MFVAYLRTFARMGLHAIPMQADTGPIGGDLSHEFIILAPDGRERGLLPQSWETLRQAEDLRSMPTTATRCRAFVDGMTADYAATDEKRDEAREAAAGDDLRSSRGIEVGHIFYFGDKYSRRMGITVQRPGRRGGAPADGQLRHRRLAPGRRDHRGEP